MRKAFRHTGVLMMMGVVALGLLGAAYTLWFEDLRLEANVTTGTFDVDLSYESATPVVAQPNVDELGSGVATLLDQDYNAFGNTFPEGKLKPTCSGEVTTDPNYNTAANDEISNNLLVLTMSNLYPYAGCEFTTDVHVVGNVPVHLAITDAGLEEYVCNDQNVCNWVALGPGDAPWSNALDPAMTEPHASFCAAFLGSIVQFGLNGGDPFILTDNDNKPIQLHQGADVFCTFKTILDQNPDAEGKTYRFWAEWRAFQWNETPSDAALLAQP